jgi:hypothetical protein
MWRFGTLLPWIGEPINDPFLAPWRPTIFLLIRVSESNDFRGREKMGQAGLHLARPQKGRSRGSVNVSKSLNALPFRQAKTLVNIR